MLTSKVSKSNKPVLTNQSQVSSNNLKKKKDIRQKYCTRSWKKQQQQQKQQQQKRLAATNLIMSIARVDPREDNFDKHKHTLSIDEIRAIAAIK